jgi:putative ABC transport system permease protein
VIRTALEMLLGDRARYFGLVVGLAFAALLITQQASIFTGFTERTASWIRDTAQADLWIMDTQTEFTEDRKPIQSNALQRVRGVAGIEWAVPMYKAYIQVRLPDGTRRNVRMVGIDDATLAGAPPIMLEGRLEDLRQDRAVIVDVRDVNDALRLTRGMEGEGPRALRMGDRLDINDHDAVVVGVAKRSVEFFWDAVIYTTYSRALRMAPRERKLMTFVLARVSPGSDAKEVARRVEAATGLAAYTSEGFEELSKGFILRKTGILENFGVTIMLGFIIGVLVAAQMLHNFVVENQKSFAAMKAMGAGNGYLLRLVSVQVAFAAAMGLGIGLGIAAISGYFLEQSGLAFQMTWQVVVLGAVGILVCCLLAAVFSLRRVLSLDPAVVFKG